MSTAIKARTARIAHLCERCNYTNRDTPSIAPGHRYLRHTAFPDGGEVNATHRPFSVTECVACLSDRDPDGPLLTADACATYCCALTPCARPLRHDGDHECRQCLDQPANPTAADITA